jgi:NADH dehydrogenase/NADH:ubiquinone oxidoreductase subunit G
MAKAVKSKMVNLTIDGKEFKAPEGMNLIDAAEIAGIHIPNLCYLKGMKGIGACRICVVEVEDAKNPVIGCNTKVKEGMVVRTQTDEIKEQRKFVIDLILSMHPLDCMTCTKAGVCNLQRYAYEFELPESSFSRKRFGYPQDVSNPFIKMSPDYCILCGKCVRVCKEQGTNVLEFMGRGVGAKVTTVVDRALEESNCTFCGTCVEVCPVNAILESDRWRRGREWDFEKTPSVCLLCGNACDIRVYKKGQEIQKIKSGGEKGSPMKYICAYGRFGFDYLESDSRLSVPMKRDATGTLVETTWSDALKIVAEHLKKAGKGIGFVSTASIENEDAIALKRFAGDVAGTRNVDTTMSLYATPEILKASEHALIADADLVMTVGINPSQRERVLPALNVSIRRKVERGTPLVVVSGGPAKLDKVATLHLGGTETDTLRALVKAALKKGAKAEKKLADMVKGAKVTEDVEKAAEMFLEAENPVIFCSPALFDAAANLTFLNGKVVAVTIEANAKGIALMGPKAQGLTYKEMIRGGMKALYAIGEIPVHDRPEGTEFLVVQNSHITELAKHADVLLPSATYLESAGSIVDYKGRLRYIPRLIEPLGEAKTHRDIFTQLAKKMGKSLKKVTDAEVRRAAKAKAAIKPSPFVRRDDLNVLPEMILESVCTALLNSPRLMWLKEKEKVTLAKAPAV